MLEDADGFLMRLQMMTIHLSALSSSCSLVSSALLNRCYKRLWQQLHASCTLFAIVMRCLGNLTHGTYA